MRTQTFNNATNVCAYNQSSDNSASACAAVTPPQYGYNWRPVAIGGGGQVTGLDLHPNGITRIARMANYGTYLWNGNRWQQLVTAQSLPAVDRTLTSDGANAATVVDIKAARSDAQRLYMVFNQRVYRSDNQGTRWSRTAAIPTPTLYPTVNADRNTYDRDRIAIDPRDPNVVYVGTSYAGLWRTLDGGGSWQQVGGVPQAGFDSGARQAMAVVMDRTSAATGGRTSVIYASSTTNGIYRSTDAGTSWTRIAGSGSAPYYLSSADVASDGTLYLVDRTDSGKLWRYRGGAWTRIVPDTQGFQYASVTVDPANANRLLIWDTARALRSTNGGSSWTEFGVGTTRTITGDVPWQQFTFNVANSGQEFRFDPVIADRVWLAESQGVWRTQVSNTLGSLATLNWQAESRGMEQSSVLSLSAPRGGTLLSGVSGQGLFTHNSLDNFPTTYRPNATPEFNSGWRLDWSESNPQFIVANTSSPGVAGGNGYARYAGYSQDGGQTWTSFGNVPTPPGFSSGDPGRFWGGDIAVAANNTSNIVWAGWYGSNSGDGNEPPDPVYSTNRGASWNRVTLPGYNPANETPGFYGRYAQYSLRQIVAADRVLPSTFYIVTRNRITANGITLGPSAGVWRSTDGGATWTQRFSGDIGDYADQRARFSAVPGQAGHLFWASGSLGASARPALRRSTDGGATWSNVPNVTAVAAFGFGAAQPGASYPAIYIAGRVGDLYGIWRSSDNAASWTQLGDYPTGILDSVNSIDADKSIYGRVYVGFRGAGAVVGEIDTPQISCASQPTITSNLSCPAGTFGVFQRVQTFNSSPAVCAYNSATDNAANTCVTSSTAAPVVNCAAQPTLNTNLACPSGFAGSFTRTQTFNSANNVCAYNAPTDNASSACTTPAGTPPAPSCLVQPTINTTLACPSGFNGNYTRTQTFNIAANVCAYNPASDNSASACTTAPPPVTTLSPPPACAVQPTITSTVACSNGFAGSFTRTQSFNPNGRFCRYNPAIDNSAVACAAPQRPSTWRERILNLNPDGTPVLDGSGNVTVNEAEYRFVAANYNREDIVDYRLGPKEADYYPGRQTLPRLFSPDPTERGLWSFGTEPRVNPGEPEKCVPSYLLPGNEVEETQRAFSGAGWQNAGQTAFVPDAIAAGTADGYGIANTRGFDGNLFRTGGLCMRLVASSDADWWNRNNISNRANPETVRLLQRNPNVPLGPVAIARGRANATQVGFAAFRDGTIIPTVVGNSVASADETGVQLPAGMVPTAMAVTDYNEFLLVTAWDTTSTPVSGKLFFIALRGPQIAGAASRQWWGLPNAFGRTQMKLLGSIQLPFAAPSSLDVANHVVLGNPRGINPNEDPAVGDFSRQSVRDAYFNAPAVYALNLDEWRQNAQAGYAMVASRAENRVAFIDMRPLYDFYRSMYFTTQGNYNATQNESVTDPTRWPYSFANMPSTALPVLATLLTVNQPTAVRGGIQTKTINGIPRFEQNGLSNDRAYARNRAYIASMDGTVRIMDVSRLAFPTASGVARTVPSTPLGSFPVGRNPTAFLHGGALSTRPDDIYVVSRADRSITYAFPDGSIQGVLRDDRLIDPVGGSVSANQAGFGGSGPGRAVSTPVITVMDFDGKAYVDFGVDGVGNGAEQYPYIDAQGSPTLFIFGSRTPVAGKPFMFTQEEII